MGMERMAMAPQTSGENVDGWIELDLEGWIEKDPSNRKGAMGLQFWATSIRVAMQQTCTAIVRVPKMISG
jgi:hypothetical protein